MPIEIAGIKLYTTEELSKQLKISSITLRNYMRSGKLKGQKVGGRWYVAEQRLREFFGVSTENKGRTNQGRENG